MSWSKNVKDKGKFTRKSWTKRVGGCELIILVKQLIVKVIVQTAQLGVTALSFFAFTPMSLLVQARSQDRPRILLDEFDGVEMEDRVTETSQDGHRFLCSDAGLNR
jgi:hypothetical protein